MRRPICSASVCTSTTVTATCGLNSPLRAAQVTAPAAARGPPADRSDCCPWCIAAAAAAARSRGELACKKKKKIDEMKISTSKQI